MKLLTLAMKSWEEFGKDNASQMAAAITYYVIFAVVPLTIFIVSVINVVAPDESRDDSTEWIESFLNVTSEDVDIVLSEDAESRIEAEYGSDALAEIEQELNAINESDVGAEERATIAAMIEAQEPVTIAGYQLETGDLNVQSDNFINQTIQGAADAAVPLGVFGFVTLAFSASIAFSAIRRSLNFVWKAPHRPFFQQRVMELSMLIGVIVLLGSSIAATTLTQIFRELNAGSQNPLTSDSGILWFLLGYLLPWALTFTLVLLAYRFVPNVHALLGDVWLGALLASLVIETLKYGYGVYVVNFSNYGAAYGALGGFLLFMFFVWLSSYIFLMGAEIASEYPKVMRGSQSAEESQVEGRPSLPRRALALVKSLFVAD